MSDISCEWNDLGCALGWLGQEIKSLFIWFYDLLMSGFAAVVEFIPAPDFLLNMGSYALPPAVAWAAEPFQFPFGIGLIVTAYTARFILRRIPAIG